ncbi:QsdR family transcriptional regulator [Pseudonocardia sp. CA-107938]|uniref:QsdR family transcriptional regulator n=1 Tax=Pseudonocardia sp. CA-107938 TaxID=3240021 RepID=UPI003D90A5E5
MSAAVADDIGRMVPEGTSVPATVPVDVFTAALDTYASRRRLDMQALARQLGVPRATLYRKVGNREQVLDEVLWWRTRRALVAAVHEAHELRGIARVVAVFSSVMRAVQGDGSLRALLEADPELGLRILTGTRSRVARGVLRAVETLLVIEAERDELHVEVDAATLAFALVRIAEGFLYADLIADRTPDTERAVQLVEALLRGLDAARRS